MSYEKCLLKAVDLAEGLAKQWEQVTQYKWEWQGLGLDGSRQKYWDAVEQFWEQFGTVSVVSEPRNHSTGYIDLTLPSKGPKVTARTRFGCDWLQVCYRDGDSVGYYEAPMRNWWREVADTFEEVI